MNLRDVSLEDLQAEIARRNPEVAVHRLHVLQLQLREEVDTWRANEDARDDESMADRRAAAGVIESLCVSIRNVTRELVKEVKAGR